VARNTPLCGRLYHHAIWPRRLGLHCASDRIIARSIWTKTRSSRSRRSIVRARLMRAMQGLMAIPLSQLGRPDSLPEAAE